jgi:WD40 repeat protein
MKKVLVVLTIILASAAALLAADGDVLEYKAKLGFTNGEDKIIEYQFIDSDRKLLIIGEKNLQLWDVESGKLLNSVTHQIPQFAPPTRGFFNKYVMLGLLDGFNWRPFVINDDGDWIITVERIGTNPLRSAIVRDLQTLKPIASMNLPNVSTESVAYDENAGEIITFGITEKTAAFARWNEYKFTVKELVTVDQYKWHQTIRDDEKMVVGSGSTQVPMSGPNIKEGDHLTLRDTKTGTVEKEYTAPNLKPETAFQETTVSGDEDFLISKRNDRIFVWEIDGNGQPRFEISNPNPKGDLSLKTIIDRKFIVVKIDEQLRIYDVAGNGTPMFELAPQNPKEDLSFQSIIYGRFVIIKADNKLRVYDTSGGTKMKYEIAPQDPKDTTEWRDISRDARFIAIADDRRAAVYELAGDGKPLYEIVKSSEKERFPVINFMRQRNLFVLARVNRSEKKEPRTEFYETSTGKMAFDVPFLATGGAMFTPDSKYLFQEDIGTFQIWNMAARKLSEIRLYYYTTENSSYNSERVEFTPDFKYVLRSGYQVTAIFETETGKQLQVLFDPAKVKYDKQNNIKNSGLSKAGWIRNGKYLYAIEQMSGFSAVQRTVNIWQLKK